MHVSEEPAEVRDRTTLSGRGHSPPGLFTAGDGSGAHSVHEVTCLGTVRRGCALAVSL